MGNELWGLCICDSNFIKCILILRKIHDDLMTCFVLFCFLLPILSWPWTIFAPPESEQSHGGLSLKSSEHQQLPNRGMFHDPKHSGSIMKCLSINWCEWNSLSLPQDRWDPNLAPHTVHQAVSSVISTEEVMSFVLSLTILFSVVHSE